MIMGLGKYLPGALLLLSVLSASFTTASASTTCEVEDCGITITLNIAFSGADDAYINRMADEIEDVWNGPDGYQTYGDCDCPVTFEVNTMKITNASQVNCDPPPPGYHCVMVTPWATKPPYFYNPDNTKNYTVGYMGYNTQSPSQGGASLDGWWSDQMSRPAPDGGTYKDAAHEAGHMMGLDDGEGGGIMSETSGPNAKPTQEQIDKVVENICGPDACPDRCCCGNGIVEGDKGEGCDPFADPVGCEQGQSCCSYCCQCFYPSCDPGKGQYPTQEGCEQQCADPDSRCYYNYKTGCWDCVGLIIAVTPSAYDKSEIRGMGEVLHPRHMEVEEFLQEVKELYNSNIQRVPILSSLFANERVNLNMEEGWTISFVTVDGRISEISPGPMEDYTVNIYSDIETIENIAEGETTFPEALGEGRIRYETVGFFNSLQFGIATFLLSIFGDFF
jgi:hypothetical protein